VKLARVCIKFGRGAGGVEGETRNDE
jgi:hypothetical protein